MKAHSTQRRLFESKQMDLFSEVLHAYSADNGGVLDNTQLYSLVAERAGYDAEAFSKKSPVGQAQQPHSLLARKVRWHQQPRISMHGHATIHLIVWT